jgi:hypothetical protein
MKLLDALAEAVRAAGLRCRGAFHPAADDGVPGPAGTLVLVGNAGPAMWRTFSSQVPAAARTRTIDPLDDWIRRSLGRIAAHFGGRALFAFDGPPFLPFQRWACRAEPVFSSPLKILIHPRFGLWHAYRGALVFAETLPLPVAETAADPCRGCSDSPCLHMCPVHAVTAADYDVKACMHYLYETPGADCRQGGCLSRRACPVGSHYRYAAEQAAFHMESFIRRAPTAP